MSSEFIPPSRSGALGVGAVSAADAGVEVVSSGIGDDALSVVSFGLSGGEEIDQLITVLAFDPGGTTGWCVVGVFPECIIGCGRDGARIVSAAPKILDSVAFWSCGQFTGPEWDQVDAMLGLVSAWSESSLIVVEDFILRSSVRDRALLSPVRITAAFSYALRSLRRSTGEIVSGSGVGSKSGVFLQSPEMAMTTMTDDRLRDSGLYAPTVGKDHARDATRHAFTYLRRLRQEYRKAHGDGDGSS